MGRQLLERLEFPDPWRSDVLAAVCLIDELDRQIHMIERELKQLGADHRYVSLLQSVPGIAWVLGYTIAAEIGEIERFAAARPSWPATPACARRCASPVSIDRRGPLSKNGPKYLRWALLEAATNACRHPVYKERYQHTKTRLGRQRGAKVAQIDSRASPDRGDLAHADPQPTLRSGKRRAPSGRLTALIELRHRTETPIRPGHPTEDAMER